LVEIYETQAINKGFKMIKTVLIDLDRLKDINTGLGQVSLYFGKGLSELQDKKLKFTFFVPKKYVGFFGNNVDYEVVSLRRRWFPATCKKYDLWYSLHQDSAYFPARKLSPYILTIHDLNFLSEKTPEKAKKRLKKLQNKINRATEITVISDFTKNEVQNNLNLTGKKVSVIYNGVEVSEYPKAEKPAYAPEGDILFSIGVIKEKKNTEVLIHFLELLSENFKLVIAGNNNSPYAKKIANLIQQKSLSNRIVMPGQISDEDKYWFLKNCKAVLFPSKFEGMGIPPIEAMRFGKPVFASASSSIPEICEDNAFYWENFNPEDMKKSFLKNINEFYQQESKSEILKKYSKKFLWENNIREYLNLFYEILNIKK